MSEIIANKDESLSVEELKKLYDNQHRDCWLCKDIAKSLEAGKELKDDQKYHFEACVLSWEHLHRHEAEADLTPELMEKAA